MLIIVGVAGEELFARYFDMNIVVASSLGLLVGMLWLLLLFVLLMMRTDLGRDSMDFKYLLHHIGLVLVEVVFELSRHHLNSFTSTPVSHASSHAPTLRAAPSASTRMFVLT